MGSRHSTPAGLSDGDLLARVKHLVQREREATTALIAHLVELDERRLYLAEGCSSLFTFCTQVLHLSENSAYGRIQAARAARHFPVVLEMLGSGSVNLTAVGLLAPHLTPENHRKLLDEARHKSKRQVEELVARVRPRPDIPASIRKLPTDKPAAVPREALFGGAPPAASPGQTEPANPVSVAATAASPAPGSVKAAPASGRGGVVPLAPERYKVQFTANAETQAKILLAQNLLRHQIPDGDLSLIFDRALTALLAQIAKNNLAATDHPRRSRGTARGSREIPAAVKRTVWKRDQGRCAFVSGRGRRCHERGFLRFHHVAPHGDGGVPTLENILLRCRAHNLYEAELYFGSHKVPTRRGARRPPTRPGNPELERATLVRERQASYSSVPVRARGMQVIGTWAGLHPP